MVESAIKSRKMSTDNFDFASRLELNAIENFIFDQESFNHNDRFPAASSSILVTGLNEQTSPAELQRMFQPFGQITQVPGSDYKGPYKVLTDILRVMKRHQY